MIGDFNKVARYLAYTLEILVLFMVQETPGLLPSVLGVRPVLLFPAVMAIAMFETEVPEIYDGTVEIKAVSREAGSRTKLAVMSHNPDVDAVGACIGTRGSRVSEIVDELGGEKIDIVEFSDEPEKFIAAALSPASVLSVEVTEDGSRSCKVTVPDNQLSLAIGNKGQNARLAAKLTGWKIDIKPESGFYGEEQ